MKGYHPRHLRGSLYYLLRRFLRFRHWERYYAKIERGGSSLTEEFLNVMLREATTRVPYYQKIARGFNTERLSLHQFPLLNKQVIQENFETLKTTRKDRRGVFLNSSGGSTGKPQTFVQDKEFVEWSIASLTYYFHHFLGVDYAEVPKVIFWGSERDLFHQRKSLTSRVVNWMTHSHFINSFRMSPEVMVDAVHLINKVRPVFIKGYASSLYEIAKYISLHNSHLWQPKFIYSSAETLQPFMREVIEKAFNAPVFDFYGSREVGSIAGQCAQKKMHIFSFNNYVEILNANNKSVMPGEEGRVVITTLHNNVMPLIRYEIGDMAVRGDTCSCGSSLPVLERIRGRVTDNFLTKDGNIVHGEYFTHLFYFRSWVKEFQVLQEAVDRVRIYYVPAVGQKPKSLEVADINEKIHLVMGKDCVVAWEKVSEVPRTPQGKLLFTRSKVYGKK